MWSGGDDYSKDGKAVRLYQPILHGRKPLEGDLRSSFIGGRTDQSPPRCAVCQDALYLLVQLFVPAKSGPFNVDRSLQLFCCNRHDCVRSIFKDDRLSYGGSGVVVCRRKVVPAASLEASQQPERVEKALKWSEEDGVVTQSSDDWGARTDDVVDLESKLASLEASSSTNAAKKKGNPTPSKSDSEFSAFSVYSLTSLQEPRVLSEQGLDDDDVGFSGSDQKIQQLLAKYMAEEDDEDILALLRDNKTYGAKTGSKAGGRRERDERLSPADRAMLYYTDRLKRSTRQVVRYAFRGVPLWSIPTQPLGTASASKISTPVVPEQPVPPCSCGHPRAFEFEVLSSILHVLNVDSFATQDESVTDAPMSRGGMNWGNIAVYSCSKSCVTETEYVVVQEPVDDVPPGFVTGGFKESDVVVIPQDTVFDIDNREMDDEDDVETDESSEGSAD